MRDLRISEADENGVVLETLDGEKFHLEIDESVRKTIKAAGARPGAQSSVTPRDIQDRVRSGQSIAEIIAETGGDLGFVEMFALPVMDELEHMIASARSVRLTVAGDRFSDDSQIEFGDLIDRRLADSGATKLSWTSKRTESATWIISLVFEIGGNYGSAAWSFDPRKVEITPEDETASALAVLDGNPGPLPKSRFATESPAAFRKPVEAAERKTQKEKATVTPLIAVPETETSSEEESEVEPVDVPQNSGATVTNVTTLQFKVEEPTQTDPVMADEEPQQGAVSEERIDEAAEAAAIEIEVEEEVAEELDYVDAESLEQVQPNSAIESSHDEDSQEPPTTTGSIGLGKKGRASMPSWDEIVFGTKTDE